MSASQASPPWAPGRLRRVFYSFQSLGWQRATVELLTRERPYDAAADLRFDNAHGTDTSGSVQPEELGIEDAGRRKAAIRYLPSPLPVTNWMLDRVAIDPAATSFVDLGCGKGRVLLLAAQRPFRAVIGVEISKELAEVAEANVARFRPRSALTAPIDVQNADATKLDLPETDLLLHLYHPFETAITAAVLRRLEASLKRNPRRVDLAYLAYTAAIEPVADALAEFPWLRRVRYEQSVRGHYNWLLYSSAR